MDSAIPRQAQVEQASVRPIVGNQIGTRLVLGCVHRLAKANDKVLRRCLGAGVSPELGISPTDETGVPTDRPGQALRAERTLQIARHQGQRHPIGVVAVGAGEQIVLQAQGPAPPAQGLLGRTVGKINREREFRAAGSVGTERRADKQQRGGGPYRPRRLGAAQARILLAHPHHAGPPSTARST